MVILYICLSFILLTLIFSFIIFRMGFYATDNSKEDTSLPAGEQYRERIDTINASIERFCSIGYEKVSVTSFDGLQLYGRLYEGDKDKPVDICFHGYRSNPVNDFCAGGRYLAGQRHNVLIIYERACGISDGHVISMSVNESKDAAEWIRFANRRFGEEHDIFLFGVSLGAATVLNCLAQPLPANVRGVIADSPFSSATGIFRHIAGDYIPFLPSDITLMLARMGCRLFGHFDLKDTHIPEAINDTDIPVLVIHGEDDLLIPCEMSRKLKTDCPRISLETFPGAGHGLSFLIDPQRYKDLLNAFFEENTKISRP